MDDRDLWLKADAELKAGNVEKAREILPQLGALYRHILDGQIRAAATGVSAGACGASRLPDQVTPPR